MADALRGSMDAAGYKHITLDLLLKFISDCFEEKHATLIAENSIGVDPEDADEQTVRGMVHPGMPNHRLALFYAW